MVPSLPTAVAHLRGAAPLGVALGPQVQAQNRHGAAQLPQEAVTTMLPSK